MLSKKPSEITPPSFMKGANKGKKEKKGGAVIPTWGSTSKDKLAQMPMFRSPGGGMMGKGTLIQRFKNLKTKDLAFITAGLAVLVMAPMAEYLISSPEDQGGTLHQGFDRKGPLFPDGTNPYEDGVAGIAPGGLMGQDSDVITPLNVRDPSSLIMSPGATQKAVAKPAAPAASPAKPSSGWKDAIKAAGAGAKKAVRKVTLPRPKGALKNLLKDWRSVVSGASRGGGPSMRLTKPDSKGLFGKPRVNSGLARVQSAPGFRGGARTLSGGSQGRGMFDGGRYGAPGAAGGGKASDTFGPGGIHGGGRGSGYGGPGSDSAGKGPGGNNAPGQKNITIGESLEFLRQKLNMQKAIDLKWAKKRYNELERKKMLEQMAAQTAQQALLKVLDKLLDKGKGDGGGGSGSGGGGSGGGDQQKPPPRRGSSVPASVHRSRALKSLRDNGTGKKAEPAQKNAKTAHLVINSAAQDYEAGRSVLGGFITQAGAQGMNKQAQSVEDLKPLIVKVHETPKFNAQPLEAPVSQSKTEIDKYDPADAKEKTRMTTEGTASDVEKGKLSKSNFTTKNQDDPAKEEYVPATVTFDEHKVPDAAAAPTKVGDPAAAAKLGTEQAKLGESNQQVVNAALAALGKVTPGEGKDMGQKPYTDLQNALKMMQGAAGDVKAGGKSYADNMKALDEHLSNARTQFPKTTKENTSKVQEKWTSAVADADAFKTSWKGLVSANGTPKAELPTKGEKTFGKVKTEADTRAKKIKTDVIDKFIR